MTTAIAFAILATAFAISVTAFAILATAFAILATAFATVYGRNSMEYSKAGGSSRKRSTSKKSIS